MLVTLKEILKIIEGRKIAVGSFNTPNIASIIAVVSAAEELDVPVILMHAEIHEEFAPITLIGPAMIAAAKNAKVPVCVHLDHGTDLDYLQKAMDLGFTGIMYDGSALPYEENAANTVKAVEMAKKAGASVEAEIGVLGKREMGLGEEEDGPEQVYTDPEAAKKFVSDTGIDALACSFGTAHGLYLKKPKLDFNVLDNVKARVDVPLVMHGGSGVSEEDYRRVISKGIRKVNYYTYMAKAGGEGVQKKIAENLELDAPKPVYFHDVTVWGKEAMQDNVTQAMKIFANLK